MIAASGSVMTKRHHLMLLALVSLAIVQLGHLLDVLRYDPDASFPSVLENPRAFLGIGLAALAFIAVQMQWRVARGLALFAGGGVAIGFILYHGIPFDLGANNPYWGAHSHADLIRWLTVLATIAVGFWVAILAVKLERVSLGDACAGPPLDA